MANETKEKMKQEIISILEINIGTVTANMYRDFYKDKDPDTIFASAKELLDEFIGNKKEKEIMEKIQKKYVNQLKA
jgi:hypothetical protein